MLVGRDRELALLAERLRERRLVTVIGPGGIGKTVLARTAAGEIAPGCALGVRTVDLTRVAAPDEVEEAIAAQLGFQTFQVLLDSPVDLSVLLLVDNCEHVDAAAAGAVSRILQACSGPTILATSRSPLGLPGEAVVALGPVAVPPPGVVDPDAPAVRLFCERVRDAGAAVAEGELGAVCELCRRLDGVPLALEIAAARARSMSPAEVLARFDEHPEVLSRPRWRGDARHRSLQATIEWSYRLLDEPSRALFDRLGVFPGPFTAVLAHAVASAPDDSAAHTFELLDGLVDASLVSADRDGSTTWYRLLEAPRGFAARRLAARGELAIVSERLAASAVAAAEAEAERAEVDWDNALIASLTGAHDSFVAALRWCLAHDLTPDRALLLVAALWAPVHRTRTEEIAGLGEQALGRWPEPAHPRWAAAAATVATARFLLGRHREAVALAEQALDAGAAGLARSLLCRVVGLTRLATGTGDTLAPFADAAEHARASGAGALAVELDVHTAEALAAAGRLADAVARLHACVPAAQRMGSAGLEVYARTVEGYVLLHTDPPSAAAVIEPALADARRIGFSAVVVPGLCALATAQLVTGRVDDAARTTLEMINELSLSGIGGLLRLGLETAAAVLHGLDRSSAVAVVATARTLPPRSAVVGVPARLLPVGAGRPFGVRDAVTLARSELRERLAAEPAPAPASPPLAGCLRRTGDLWEVQFCGQTISVRHGKGMADLARLLASPFREIHCAELAGSAVEASTTGEVLDPAARRAYEQRIRELQTELDDAEAAADLIRAEKAATELDALVEHLTTALGRHGRARNSGSSVERARSAVTHRIRATVRRISTTHPRLGRHLDVSVRTGTYCSYHPEEPVRWETPA